MTAPYVNGWIVSLEEAWQVTLVETEDFIGCQAHCQLNVSQARWVQQLERQINVPLSREVLALVRQLTVRFGEKRGHIDHRVKEEGVVEHCSDANTNLFVTPTCGVFIEGSA